VEIGLEGIGGTKMKRLFVIIMTFFFLSKPLLAQGKEFIAVLDLQLGSGVNPELRVPLSLELAKCFSETGKFRVLDRKNVNAILKKRGFMLKDCTTDECIVKVGRFLLVEKIVTGNISKIGDTYAIAAMVTNVLSGGIEAMESLKSSCREEELSTRIHVIAKSLLGAIIPPEEIRGRLLFDDKLITRFTSVEPEFWIKCTVTDKNPDFQVFYDNGRFRIIGLSKGSYVIGTEINTNEKNPAKYPGDYNGYQHFKVTQDTPELVINMKRIIHLTNPADNGLLMKGFAADCKDQEAFKSPVIFAWEPLGRDVRDVYYEYNVRLVACPYKHLKTVTGFMTKDTQVELDLPPNKGNEYYSFRLKAKKPDDSEIGIFITHGYLSYGWDYRFRVVE
jgi:hypothetical protein